MLDSIGLIDLARDEPEVSGDGMSVDVMYRPVNITSGVHVRASLDWTPGDVVKAQYPDWDVQNRSMRIYVSDGQQEPSLAVDFWVKFDRTGRFAIRPGRLVLPESDGPDGRDSVVLEFVDDQLLTMVRKIYTAFHQNFQEFQRDDRILSLERDAPVGRQLMAIEQAWSDGRACTESSSVASAHLPHARITEHLHRSSGPWLPNACCIRRIVKSEIGRGNVSGGQ